MASKILSASDERNAERTHGKVSLSRRKRVEKRAKHFRPATGETQSALTAKFDSRAANKPQGKRL